MVEQGNQTDDGSLYHYVPSYVLHANEIYPRVAGAITFISSVYMIVMAWSRRQFLFHNLVIGMGINFIVYGAFLMYGTAAIPSDDESIEGFGNMGTTATCTTQGFFLHVCGSTVAFYYSSISIYCYVAFINDFKKEKIVWVEKWIHLLVHIFPIMTGIWLLSINGFNNTNYGMCGPASYPWRCEFDPNMSCERGPQGPKSVNVIMGVNIALILLFPTVVTVYLIFTIEQRQNQENYIPAKAIGPQLCIYIVAIYYVSLPYFILNFIPDLWVHWYPFLIFAILNYSLFGLWFMIVYSHFFIWLRKLFRRIQQEKEQHQHQQQQQQQQLNCLDNSSSSSD